MQIRTTMKHLYVPTEVTTIFFLKKLSIQYVGKNVRQLEISYIAGRNIK